ncbi:glycosyl transferase [Opitutaceae bacterium EW11]|nr:glycosyl transferase [Opitutaceae bacterium EW11]
MPSELLASALIQSMARSLSVTDLIRTAETLKQSGQPGSVEVLYGKWIEHNHDHPLLYAVLFNHAVVLTDSGKLAAARECLERALKLNPEFMPAHINLGRVYERQGSPNLAVVQWSTALAKLAPVTGNAITYKTTALNQSARTLEAANQDEVAEAMLKQSLELDPHQREVAQHYVALRQRQCKWPIVEPWERVNHETLMQGMSPLSIAAQTDDPMLHLALAAQYNRLDVGSPPNPFFAWPRARGNGGRLRIGYLSSDLREHAVGYLMAEVFGLHDRSKVEVFVYYCGPAAKDPLHTGFRNSADHWLSITELDDATVAKRMVDDGIQILVDLNGYTREARLKLVALRPAPVIVNWLGFPGTMASPYHHFLLADEWIVPPGYEIFYSEEVMRLPCYQPNNRKRAVSPRPLARRDCGLPENAMVYCCFNGAHKIHRFAFDRWMTILKAVPGSVLWLLGSTGQTNERLRAHAVRQGVAAERLVFADKLANPYHLCRYTLADLFLDTSPYGAHTTASDALWMGLPVLTLSGRSFASRVCGSLVRSAGLPEMVCLSAKEYVDRAIAFGQDRAALLPVRDKLRSQRETCTLFDMPRLVRELEERYRQMWRRCEEGTLPQPDLANLEVYLEVGAQAKTDENEALAMRDYAGWWKARLALRHRVRPFPLDRRYGSVASAAGETSSSRQDDVRPPVPKTKSRKRKTPEPSLT